MSTCKFPICCVSILPSTSWLLLTESAASPEFVIKPIARSPDPSNCGILFARLVAFSVISKPPTVCVKGNLIVLSITLCCCWSKIAALSNTSLITSGKNPPWFVISVCCNGWTFDVITILYPVAKFCGLPLETKVTVPPGFAFWSSLRVTV